MILPIRKIMNSITVRLISGVYIIVIPLILLLIYSNNQSRTTLSTQLTATYENLLQSYLQQIDNQLDNARTYAANLALFENDTLLATFSTDETTAQYAKLRLKNSMEERALMSNIIDGYFTCLQTREGESFLISSSSSSYGSDRTLISNYVKEYLSQIQTGDNPGSSGWYTHTLDNTDYLIYMMTNGGEICSGAYINMSLLPSHLTGNDLSAEILFLPASSLAPLQEDTLPGMRLISQNSGSSPAVLTTWLNETELLNTLPFLQKYTHYITLMLILLVILMYLLIRYIVTLPLKRLTNAMSHIQNGNLEHRLQQQHASTEIQIVNNAFNHMIDQVQNLKINVYEETLKTQRSQLRNLQLQIRPHFLINSLNTIYNAVENDNKQLASKLILHSADYFRYMVKVDDDFVPLNEELEHIITYLDIQTLRYPDLFTYSIKTDPRTEDALVVPLLVQTFVENSLKYALHMSDTLHIHIEAESFELDFVPYIKLRISDTGSGYPDGVIEALKNDEPIIDGRESHIGIRNAIRRMDILFQGDVKWDFYNETGAVSEVTLPAIFADMPASH